jgi:thioredoxin-like negative regulator of GroEL
MTVSALGSERPRLLFFSDSRSGRTKRVEAHLAQVLQRRHNHDTFRLHTIEMSGRPDLASRFQVDTAPTLIVVENRSVRARLVMPRGCNDIRLLLDPWLR